MKPGSNRLWLILETRDEELKFQGSGAMLRFMRQACTWTCWDGIASISWYWLASPPHALGILRKRASLLAFFTLSWSGFLLRNRGSLGEAQQVKVLATMTWVWPLETMEKWEKTDPTEMTSHLHTLITKHFSACDRCVYILVGFLLSPHAIWIEVTFPPL